MSDKLNFQELIMHLERFWADRGCTIWQPHSEKVGAGTMNPATVLRVLGPEPWNVAYVEPSYRPDDGRFAENPNRMQMFTQYQVILQPDPGNPQELYLDSLEALGLDSKRHDIRFVEDDWESPALGAWGLGWEVWLDGMEITQFTYFQQAGGVALDPVAVELTYGLERIAMYLQEAREVWDLRWDDRLTYGDILKVQELEYCHYAFNLANVERLRSMYTLFLDEAREAIDRDLTVPAHDYVLRCSHAFNLLDTRGAIGVTERARYFAEMRDLARQVSESFAKRREEMDYPLLPGAGVTTVAEPASSDFLECEAADLLLEVGSEELPAADVDSGIVQLRKLLTERLNQERLSFGAIEVGGTPRRLFALARNVSGRQPDEERWVRGPAVRAAYDEKGKPTRALEGFSRAQGVDPESVEHRSNERGVEYVFALRKETGGRAQDILAEALPELVAALRFPKTMRWDSDGVAYARPIRWIVALFGDQIIPFAYAKAVSGRTTSGLRPDGCPEIDLNSAGDYLQAMETHGVLADRSQRRNAIEEQITAAASGVDGMVPDDPDLLDEVTDLVEAPFALQGTFEESHLSLPQEVLVTVMKKHQRYFPVLNPGTGKLMPYFIAVANGRPSDPGVVIHGNEGVIRARYADAAYFYRRDTERTLEAHLPRLDTLTFQENLGSVLEKSRRIEKLLGVLAPDLGLNADDKEAGLRAARLCKADLGTSMVVEMTSLQGTMGRYYAQAGGEPEAVGRAIEEHYRPRFPGDDLPRTRPGIALSVADRLDSLAGLFVVGVRPRATADPYGLRRDALGLLANLIGHRCHFSLRRGLAAAAAELTVEPEPDSLKEALDFILRRLAVQLREEGFPHDLVEATINGGCDDPFELRHIAEELARIVQTEDWLDTLHAYARCKRIVRDLTEVYPLAVETDSEDATRALYGAYEMARGRMDGSDDRVAALAGVLEELRGTINHFFDKVLVMADDPALRQTRLALVQRIASLPDGIADLGRLEGF